MAFAGASGRLPLTSVQVTPRLVVRKTCASGSCHRNPDSVAYAIVSLPGSTAMRVTQRSGSPAPISFQVVPLSGVAQTRPSSVPAYSTDERLGATAIVVTVP